MNECGVRELRTQGGTCADSIQDALDFIKGCEDEHGSFDAVITDANNNPVRIYYGGVWFTVAQEQSA